MIVESIIMHNLIYCNRL